MCLPILFVRYPAARRMQRRIVYHMGPTNSGKTYTALNRFAQAESGIALRLPLSKLRLQRMCVYVCLCVLMCVFVCLSLLAFVGGVLRLCLGVYCGPLRLLALEVHDKINAQGVPCNLLTGTVAILLCHTNCLHICQWNGLHVCICSVRFTRDRVSDTLTFSLLQPTGEERREVEGAKHVASTVEMTAIDKPIDVAVIDEIQVRKNVL